MALTVKLIVCVTVYGVTSVTSAESGGGEAGRPRSGSTREVLAKGRTADLPDSQQACRAVSTHSWHPTQL
jgi:hypothetical protein